MQHGMSQLHNPCVNEVKLAEWRKLRLASRVPLPLASRPIPSYHGTGLSPALLRLPPCFATSSESQVRTNFPVSAPKPRHRVLPHRLYPGLGPKITSPARRAQPEARLPLSPGFRLRADAPAPSSAPRLYT
jgi:hypothetical protein